MPQLVNKRRSRLAVLVVSALVASMLAVPAGAVMDKADHTTSANACVGPATGDQMFTDVSDMHTFKDAINCIAYYGITKGTGDGSTYSPNDTVSRWQMALFMARAAGPAGLTLPMAADQGFADIGDAPAEAHDAINQLAAAGIMAGKSATMFDPNGTVSRADMAVILVNMLAQASSAVTIDKNGDIKLGAAGTDTADDYFPDARASQPRATDARIAAAYELGITTGTTMAPERAAGQTYAGLLTSFGPNSPVNRGEMAAFITRALNHTNARPEGVSAYRDGTTIKASVRDAELNPVSGARIDLFYGATAKAGEAFGQAGTCDTTVVKSKTGMVCRIDSADPVTNSSGNVALAGPDNIEHTVETPQTVWVWTGSLDMIVVTATERFRYDLPEAMAPTLVATRTLVSDDSGGATLFRYGSDRTITLQLQNVDDGPPQVITNTSSGTMMGESAKWTYIVRLCSADPTDADGTCDANLLSQSASMALTSDSNGQATIAVSAPSDPTPGATDTDDTTDGQQPEERWVSVALTSGDNAPDAANTVDAAGAGKTVFEYKFSDLANAATANAGKVTHQSPYVVLASATTPRGSQLVTVTVNDQYGSPMAGQVVTLTAATPADVSVQGGPYSTDSNGEAVIVYTLAATQVGWGEFEVLANVGDPAVQVAAGTVYFVEANSASESETEIDYIDVANKTIVANNKVVVYDSGDQFTIGTTPSTMAEFEAKLAAESMRATIDYSIAWTNYPTDPTKRSTTTSTFTLIEA